jgi:hypothetical protein
MLNWKYQQNWSVDLGDLNSAAIVKNPETYLYTWVITRRKLDFGFGATNSHDIVMSGKTPTLRLAKKAIREYQLAKKAKKAKYKQ